MTRWNGLVLALPEPEGGPMVSRLPPALHPVAGRPLVWHTIAGLAGLDPRPEGVVVIAGPEIGPDLFQGIPIDIRLIPSGADLERVVPELLPTAPRALVLDAASHIEGSALQRLLEGAPGRWLGGNHAGAAAALLDTAQIGPLFRLPDPLTAPSGVLAAQGEVGDDRVWMVRNRHDLARVVERLRDRLVQQLMEGGVTFLLPSTVLLDVDVRIGRDTVVYPNVILEGETTIGEETVVGPGCRIVDSWIGSGVELKGWNYISHTSIRNRAILEPYVRRGFD